jgi:hypothetical protein
MSTFGRLGQQILDVDEIITEGMSPITDRIDVFICFLENLMRVNMDALN